MARIIIASTSETNRTQFSRLLAPFGYQVFRTCAGESELRRTLNDMDDGIVIIAGPLGEGVVEDLLWDFGDRFQFLWIARLETFSFKNTDRLFHLAYPCSAQQIAGAVEMLNQLHYMRLPKRSANEQALVEQAKRLMMQKFNISEMEAHRRLQQHAMHHGIKLTEYAAQLLQWRDEHA